MNHTMTHYYICRANKISGKKTLITSGICESHEECVERWLHFVTGFMASFSDYAHTEYYESEGGSQGIDAFRIKSKDEKWDFEYYLIKDPCAFDIAAITKWIEL